MVGKAFKKMDPNNIPPQSYYMRYDGPFTREFDDTFLDTLVYLKNKEGWNDGEIPDVAKKTARLTVNYRHGGRLTWDDVQERIQFFHLRYRTFREVANFKGAQPDWPNNVVYAEDAIWRKMFKKNPFAAAYREKGDPQWKRLSILFGSNDVKIEQSKTIVNISSNSLETSQEDKTLVLSDEEEVTSPVVNSARRKLFGEEPSTYVELCAPVRSRIPPKNAFPIRPNFGAEGSSNGSKNDSASSCASSSPAKHVWGPFN